MQITKGLTQAGFKYFVSDFLTKRIRSSAQGNLNRFQRRSSDAVFRIIKIKKPLNYKGFPLDNWWRRRESNPRPRTFRQSFYIHSLCINFVPPNSHRQDSGRTSLWRFAPHPISIGEELSCFSDIPACPTGESRRDAGCS